MRRHRLFVICALTLVLGACSQAASLAPVSGGPITSVRIAVYDVLVEQEVSILVAPQCAPVSNGFSCKGTTTDGQEIQATADGAAPYPLTITVGGAVIFQGNAQDVLDKAAEVTS
ncbi:MAG: hypothetical protein ACKOW5_04180 [Actinomycetales bacterium]